MLSKVRTVVTSVLRKIYKPLKTHAMCWYIETKRRLSWSLLLVNQSTFHLC